MSVQNQIQNPNKTEPAPKRFEVCGWEWDSDNGEYVSRDYYCDEVVAEDIQEALEKATKWLEDDVKEAESDGWVCEGIDGDVTDGSNAYVSVTCSKLSKDCVELCREAGDGEECEAECYVTHEVGYDVREVRE